VSRRAQFAPPSPGPPLGLFGALTVTRAASM
jgi:hypothetical protein